MNVCIQEARDSDLSRVVARANPNIPGAEHTLAFCYSMSSECWLGLVDDEIACIWGLIPPSLLSYKAYLWMLSTDVVEKHKFAFVRHSQVCVERMLEKYPEIVGHCQAGADRSIRWLQWLGARFDYPEGHRIPFSIRKKQ